MEKILIAGGTGYIGSEAVQAALKLNYEVFVLTRSTETAEKLRSIGVEPIVGDLYEENGEWQEVAKKVDYATFIASPPTWGKKVTKKVALNFQQGHKEMTQRFLHAFENTDVKKVVYIAGTSYFGDAGDQKPQTESMRAEPKGWGPYIAPSVRLLPTYISKGIPLVIAFPGQVYGPASWLPQLYLEPIYRGKVVNRLKGYNPLNSPIHVEDCGRAIVHLLAEGKSGESYLLIDDEPVPSDVLQMAIAESMNKELKYREVPKWLCSLLIGPVLTDYATAHTNFSNGKLKETGFEFLYPTYKDGIPDVVKTWLDRQ